MKRLLTISFASLFITLSACGPAEEEPQGDCSVDNDCKGDRICQEGSCVDPTSSNNSTTANNSTTMNNATSSNNQTAQPATCAQFCDKVVGCYPRPGHPRGLRILLRSERHSGGARLRRQREHLR